MKERADEKVSSFKILNGLPSFRETKIMNLYTTMSSSFELYFFIQTFSLSLSFFFVFCFLFLDVGLMAAWVLCFLLSAGAAGRRSFRKVEWERERKRGRVVRRSKGDLKVFFRYVCLESTVEMNEMTKMPLWEFPERWEEKLLIYPLVGGLGVL